MYKAVFSDIDGTLLNSNHVVTALTKDKILSLRQQNIPFVIVSARSPSGIYPIMRKNGFHCPIIAYSGALILDEDGNMIYQNGMEPEQAGKIIDFIEDAKFALTWNLFSMDDWIVKDKTDPKVIREETIVEACSREGFVGSIPDGEKVHKILCICEADKILEIEEKIKAEFPDFNVVKSSDILLEIMPKGVNKAESVKYLCDYWKIALEDVIAFGDNYNDLEMLEAVGCGVVMGNAPEDIQVRFQHITRDNDHDGIAYMLENLESMAQKDFSQNMLSEFYRAVEAADPKRKNMTMVVVEGDAFGGRALFTDGRMSWTSGEKTFFSAHRKELEAITEGGLHEIGGQKVFCEWLGSEKHMVICGGGHVSIPLIKMGRMLGFYVTVLEDRPKFADHARKAGASEVICDSFEQGLETIEGTEDTFFIIVTRGHRFDQTCLERILQKKHAYIGMIGSRRRAARVKDAILENGGDAKILDTVHTPIGLDIGAETPEEIAVAIMAELIEVKNRTNRNDGYSKELMRGIFQEKEKVLATIVSRKGSTPRKAGTKMLIFADGRCIDSIGGGCAEAEICQKALRMLRAGEEKAILCHVDMTGEDAEEEGMVCGGILDILLEVIG